MCYFMVYGSLGELTKLCAYNFSFWFQVLPLVRGRARDDSIAHTIASVFLSWEFSLETVICFDTVVMLHCYDLWDTCSIVFVGMLSMM